MADGLRILKVDEVKSLEMPRIGPATLERIFDLYDRKQPWGTIESNPKLVALIREALPGFITDRGTYGFGTDADGDELNLALPSREPERFGQQHLRIHPDFGVELAYAERLVESRR